MCCSLVQADLERGVLPPHLRKCYVTNMDYPSRLRTDFPKYALRVIAEHCGLGTENREQPFLARFVPNDIATACQMSEENGLSLPWASITLPTNVPKGSCIGLCPRNALRFPSQGTRALHVAGLTFPVEPDYFWACCVQRGMKFSLGVLTWEQKP